MTGPADATTTAAYDDGAAALAIARAQAVGVVLHLGPDGRVTLSAPQPPDETVLAGLRRHRDRIIVLLTEEAEGTAPPNDPNHPDAVAAAQRAEARGDFGAPAAPERDREAVAGLLRGFLGTGPQPTLEMLA